jgi:hypothetical protein
VIKIASPITNYCLLAMFDKFASHKNGKKVINRLEKNNKLLKLDYVIPFISVRTIFYFSVKYF